MRAERVAEASVTKQEPSCAVLLWAAVGVASTGIGLTALVRWLFSDDLSPTPNGPDRLADVHLGLLRVAEVASVAVALFVIWRFVIKPIMTEHRLSFDGMFVIGSALMWWMDPLVNFYNFSFMYNTHLVNLGSWTRFIPGWQAPNQHLFPEPLFLIGAAYVWWPLGIAALGGLVMRKVQARRPAASLLRLLVWVFAVNACLYVIGENVLIHGLRVLVFPGVPKGFGLFTGHWYQFPLSEPIGMGVFGVVLTSLRVLRDDHGRSYAQRGVQRLAIGPKLKEAVSLFAVIGAVHGALLAYYVVYLPFTLRAGTAPAQPSYLRGGICGTGTDYACPSHDSVPIPSRSSLHIRPDDPRLPESVRRNQGSAAPNR